MSANVRAEEAKSFAGEITADRVNVRSGPHLNFEIIYTCNRGDKIIIIGEQYDWYKIKLPESAILYISKEFIDNKNNTFIVKADDVNIRAGTGLEYNIVGQLLKGDKIDIITETGAWYGIKAPKGCFGWIYKKYIKFYATVDQYELELKRKEAASENYTKLVTNYAQELKKDFTYMRLDVIRADFEKFILSYPDSPEARLSQEKIDKINLKSAEIENMKAKAMLKEAEQEFKSAKKILDEKIALIQQIEVAKDTPKKEEPIARGIIRDVGIILNRPARYKLCEGNNILYYLKSERVNLNKFINRNVKVWGEAIPLPGSSKKFILVTSVEEID
jgi:uncharacterized protein YgiM (DUF1202 family)